ncbi:hypothetical protein [Candidatus Albibeggiatoa sp. nov. NOAA]|uniref:hypothetical protein n=1 Tax=Candidatus Albibeggiatoa sp. nov. NOAA TaxID=3162724 RepID=UPI0032F4806D|nr:hypothetical protein [Thiotrichaceae bacterium]
MKSIYYLLGFMLCLYSLPSHAAPPYIAVSVGENFSFTNPACIAASRKVLKSNGFKKFLPAGANLFAAFNPTKDYKYKAMVRCIDTQGVFVVAIVANSTKTIKAKAQNIRLAIQKSFAPAIKSDTATKPSDIQVVAPLSAATKTVKPSYGGNSAKTWQDSLLGRSKCLERGETALRNSGFARNFEIDYEKLALFGVNESGYQGIVRCLPEQKIILFKVSGKSSKYARRLLEILQLNF